MFKLLALETKSEKIPQDYFRGAHYRNHLPLTKMKILFKDVQDNFDKTREKLSQKLSHEERNQKVLKGGGISVALEW